jgi:galactose-1-phosphate uridylyltransferase
MVNGKLLIEKLIAYAKSFLNLDDLDVIYVRNTLLAEFRIDSAYNGDVDLDYVKEMSVPDVFFDEIKDYAVENGISADETQATLFAAYIFGLLTPKPSTVIQLYAREIRSSGGVQLPLPYKRYE